MSSNESISEEKRNQSSKREIESEINDDRSDYDAPAPSIWSKIGFGFGHIYNDLCASIWFSYLLMFLKNVLVIPGGGAGGLMMFGQAIDAAATPVVGLLSDKFGTKQIWHIFGSVLVCLSFPIIYVTCPMCGVWPGWWRYCYLSIVIMLFQIGWPIVQVVHMAIIPEIASTQKDRNQLSSVRYSAQVISSIIAFTVTSIILGIQSVNSKSKISPDDAVHFQYIAGILTLIGICMTVIFQLSLTFGIYKQRQTCNSQISRHISNGYQRIGESNDSETQPTETNPLLSPGRPARKNFFKSSTIYRNALLYVCGRVFTTTSLIYIPLWLDDQLKSKLSLATVPLVSYLASFITSLPIDILIRKIGHRTVYVCGAIVAIAGCILVETSTTVVSDAEIYTVAVIFGAASSITVISSLCLIADMIGPHTEQSGTIYSAVTTVDKLATGIIVLTLEVSQNSHDHYKHCLSRVCGGAVIIAAVNLAMFSLVGSIRTRFDRWLE